MDTFTAHHDAAVRAAYTYNAPGFGGAQAQLLEYLGIGSATSANSKITNVYATDGISATAGLGTLLGSRIGVRIEPDAIPTGNHSILKLSDSLAVQALLPPLDVGVSQSTTNALVQAASAQVSDTLESLLYALQKTLLGPSVAKTATDDRNALYLQPDALAKDPAFTALAGKLHVETVSSALSSEARTEFSALVALDALSTLVLQGSNTPNQDLLNSTLGSAHGNLYALWQADQGLSSAERAAGKANVSDAWLVRQAEDCRLKAVGQNRASNDGSWLRAA